MSKPTEEQPRLQDFARAMKRDWDERARQNAKWFINTVKLEQSDEEFDETGRPEVEQNILADRLLLQGRDPRSLRLLEIGCGIGRMTRLLAEHFGEVWATDVSGEMIRQARARLREFPNVRLYETNGVDLAALPRDYFDLAFSAYVFQHVPDPEVIRSNIKEAYRVLKPGGAFKFQTSSITDPAYAEIGKDTWTGASFPESELRRLARELGARLVYVLGAGTQYCWTLLHKRSLDAAAIAPLAALRPEIVFYGRADAPEIKQVPAGGDQAYLTLKVTGLAPEEVDANSLVVEVRGREVWPIYVGPAGESLVTPPECEGGNSPDRLTQINLQLPAGLSSGPAEVRVRLTRGEVSAPVMIELLEPQPPTPRIQLVTNGDDGGVDIHARGPKSTLRLLVTGLDETADTDNLRLQVGERRFQPSAVRFVPANGVYQVEAKLPEDVGPGLTGIKVHFNGLQSPGVALIVRGAADDADHADQRGSDRL